MGYGYIVGTVLKNYEPVGAAQVSATLGAVTVKGNTMASGVFILAVPEGNGYTVTVNHGSLSSAITEAAVNVTEATITKVNLSTETTKAYTARVAASTSSALGWSSMTAAAALTDHICDAVIPLSVSPQQLAVYFATFIRVRRVRLFSTRYPLYPSYLYGLRVMYSANGSTWAYINSSAYNSVVRFAGIGQMSSPQCYYTDLIIQYSSLLSTSARYLKLFPAYASISGEIVGQNYFSEVELMTA